MKSSIVHFFNVSKQNEWIDLGGPGAVMGGGGEEVDLEAGVGNLRETQLVYCQPTRGNI